MQIMESEIILPLKYKALSKGSFIFLGGLLVYVVALDLFLLNMASQAAARAKVTFASDPALAQNIAHQWTTEEIWIIAALVLELLIYGLFFAFQVRKLRTPSPSVRINREGIFTSRDSLLIKWAEIKELSPATFMGSPYLRIVPWNLAEVASRAKRSSGRFLRFGINLTLLLFGRSKSPAPIGLSQRALPISIDELLTAIQERFASELQEHHIVVRRSQP